MLIINADDWGGWREATDAAAACFRAGRITSATAMVFMDDSPRGAELAKDLGIEIGLHLNLTQEFTAARVPADVQTDHARVCRFLRSSRYAVMLYHPALQKAFRRVCAAQFLEFERLYGRPAAHVDGHHHKHLSMNALVGGMIPRNCSVRRNFSFQTGEKNFLNRTYRAIVDGWLRRRHPVADYFVSLGDCLQADNLGRVADRAQSANVELMTHPAMREEFEFLMSRKGEEFVRQVRLGRHAELRRSESGKMLRAASAPAMAKS